MSVTFSMVFLLPAAEETHFLDRLWQTGTLEQCVIGPCAVLDLPLDDVVFAYLADNIAERWGNRPTRETHGFDRAYPDYFSTEATGRVGCWYVATLPGGAGDRVYVQVQAATGKMSRLLQRSHALRRWFEELGCEVHATAAFLDLEHEGVEFLCRDGRPIFAALDAEGQVLLSAPADRPFVEAIFWEYDRLYEEYDLSDKG